MADIGIVGSYIFIKKGVLMKVIFLVLCIILTGCSVVSTGSRGIETRFGEVIGKPKPEGLYFYNPITTTMNQFSVQQNKWSDKTPIFTKDTQRVDVDFSVVFYSDPAEVHTLFQQVGNLEQVVGKIVQPVVLGSIKDAIGQVIADELIMKRETVTKQALALVSESLRPKHIVITDLQFTNLDFDDAYEKAVEEKVVALQNAQKAKNDTVRINEQANQIVLTAKADAEAMRIKSQALSSNKGLIDFEIAKKWDGKLPEFMMGNTVPMLNLSSLKKHE
jgi:regulator of protease activity HflC (stomatin/prohibitin superfamily)